MKAPFRPELHDPADTRHFDDDIPAEVGIIRRTGDAQASDSRMFRLYQRQMAARQTPPRTHFSKTKPSEIASFIHESNMRLLASRTRVRVLFTILESTYYVRRLPSAVATPTETLRFHPSAEVERCRCRNDTLDLFRIFVHFTVVHVTRMLISATKYLPDAITIDTTACNDSISTSYLTVIDYINTNRRIMFPCALGGDKQDRF